MILLYTFLTINLITFFSIGYDKKLAQNNKRRIPEKILFLQAILGGSIGLLIAMLLFRHKTSKRSFILKFSAIVFIQLLVAVMVIYNIDIFSISINEIKIVNNVDNLIIN